MSNLEADHELGQFRDKPESVHPLRLAINLANDFEPQASDGGKQIEVRNLTFDSAFGNRSLLVVKNLVAQALSNLIENAVKYSTSGTTIYIEGAQITIESSGKTWTGISVRNTGLPISPDEVKKLTDRGFRGNAAKQKIPAGTGIGLYLADRVMELHEGMIHVSAKGHDTKMTLLFPDSRIQ